MLRRYGRRKSLSCWTASCADFHIAKHRWKRTLYKLFESPTSSQSAFLIHVTTTALIVFSACVTILETLPPFHATPTHVWFGIETSLVVLFTVEYVCRLLAHSETWRELFRWCGCECLGRVAFSVIDGMGRSVLCDRGPAGNIAVLHRDCYSSGHGALLFELRS